MYFYLLVRKKEKFPLPPSAKSSTCSLNLIPFCSFWAGALIPLSLTSPSRLVTPPTRCFQLGSFHVLLSLHLYSETLATMSCHAAHLSRGVTFSLFPKTTANWFPILGTSAKFANVITDFQFKESHGQFSVDKFLKNIMGFLFENHLTYKRSRLLFLSFFSFLTLIQHIFVLVLTALATNHSFSVVVFIHNFSLQWWIDASQILTLSQSSVSFIL